LEYIYIDGYILLNDFIFLLQELEHGSNG